MPIPVVAGAVNAIAGGERVRQVVIVVVIVVAVSMTAYFFWKTYG